MIKQLVFISLWLLIGPDITTFAQTFVKQLPEKPKTGDSIVITYNSSASQAKLSEAKEITIYILCYDMEGKSKILEPKMIKTNNLWTGSFKIENEVFFAYYFDDGINLDYNEEQVWYSMVYDKKQQVLPGANYFLGMLYLNIVSDEFKVFKSISKSLECFNNEIASNPSFVFSYIFKWRTAMHQKHGNEFNSMVRAELEKVYKLNKKNEEAVYRLLPWFEIAGEKEKGENIMNSFLKKNPKGYTAIEKSIDSLLNESDSIKKLERSKKILHDFSNLNVYQKATLNQIIFSIYLQQKDYEAAYNLISGLESRQSGQYDLLARSMIEKGEQLEKATKWAKEGVILAENYLLSAKPLAISTKKWKLRNELSLGNITDTYAYGLFQLKNYTDAEKYFEKSYFLLNGNDTSANNRYVECLLKNKNYGRAVEVAEECQLKGKSNLALIENYKIAWFELNRSIEEFESRNKEIKALIIQEKINEFKKDLLNIPAKDFSLYSLDGKQVNLVDLKGKIVVMCFWATWSKNCLELLPTLQKISELYKSKPEISILAINTWEIESGNERIAFLKEYMKSNQYNFEVILDDNYYLNYVLFDIPLILILDRYGKIQFKTVGFVGEAKMLSDMEAQFEILLNDDYLEELD